MLMSLQFRFGLCLLLFHPKMTLACNVVPLAAAGALAEEEAAAAAAARKERVKSFT